MTEEPRRDDARGMLIGGLITLGVGTFFLLDTLDLIPSIGKMWPLIPIVIGVAMVVGALSRGRRAAGG